MKREEIIAAINSTFIEQFEISEDKLTPDKQIFNDLGLDSLDIVDLMVGLQRRFGVSLRENEEIRKVVTLGDVYEFFVRLEAKRNQPKTWLFRYAHFVYHLFEHSDCFIAVLPFLHIAVIDNYNTITV